MREEERDYWETGTWFDEAVLSTDPGAERLCDAVEQTEWAYDDERRELRHYLYRVGEQRKHGGRRVVRRLGYVPDGCLFGDGTDEATGAAVLLAALDACAAHADLTGGPPAPKLAEVDLHDDLLPTGNDDEGRSPPDADALVAVHALTGAPSAPPCRAHRLMSVRSSGAPIPR